MALSAAEIKRRVNLVFPGCLAFEVRGDVVSVIQSDFRKGSVALADLVSVGEDVPEATAVTDQAEKPATQKRPKRGRTAL